MSRYESKKVAYNPQKKKNVPIWRLDTNTLIVTHFNADTLTEESKTYYTDYIRYHLHYSDNKYPDRLRKLVNTGKIVQVPRRFGTESRRSYLSSGGALETD